MVTLEEEDHTAVNGADQKVSTQDDSDREQPYNIPGRGHVDALLDISEENFLKEEDPYEYHCYSAWEETVRGWSHVAPLSCILLTQKGYQKPKRKEAENPPPLSAEPTPSNADSSFSFAEQSWESDIGLHDCKKFMWLNQQTESGGQTGVAAQQPDAGECSVFNSVPTNTTHLLEEKLKEKETPLQPHRPHSRCDENRSTKPRKHSLRPNNRVIPIKSLTFLPPIKAPHLNPKVGGHRCRDKKAPEGGTLKENCIMSDKRSGIRGTRVDPVASSDLPTYSAALTSNCQTYQHNPHLLSAVNVSVHKRYQVPMSTKPDPVHRTNYSLGKSFSPAVAQPHLNPSCLFS
ncbi:uncharacterized protein C16orf46 homolog [Embiotoca jacksoni]|uniref:uncharacterized protein C16orf46 homolog n=1 Tax=Embiotoca jacksoni TaxID=100190 RepID=UPI0037048CF2